MRFPIALSLLAAVLLAAPALHAQNVSGDPNFGEVHLEGGFLPDPHVVELVAGGSVAVNVPGCDYGHVSENPDVDFYYNASGGRNLYIFAISDEDTTLLINAPDGTWYCDDDSFDDGDPILFFPNAPAGLYNIWVGTFGEAPAAATLFISEIEPD